MAWFKQLFKRKQSNTYQFDTMDRILSAKKRDMTRKIKHARQMLELEELQNQLDEYRDEPEEFDNTSRTFDEELIMSFIQPLINKSNSPVPSNINTSQGIDDTIPQQNNTAQEITDQDILTLMKQLPKQYIRMGKKLADNELGSAIKLNMPHLTNEAITRCITIFRQNF